MQHHKTPSFSLKKTGIVLIVVAVVAASFFGGYTYSRLTTEKTVNSGANLVTTVNLSLYADSVTNTQLLSIDWGIILPGRKIVASVVSGEDAFTMRKKVVPVIARQIRIDVAYIESLRD